MFEDFEEYVLVILAVINDGNRFEIILCPFPFYNVESVVMACR